MNAEREEEMSVIGSSGKVHADGNGRMGWELKLIDKVAGLEYQRTYRSEGLLVVIVTAKVL